MTTQLRGSFAAASVLLLTLGNHAIAQTGLRQAVLALPSNTNGSFRAVNGRLYGGSLAALIADRDGNPSGFGSDDYIDFALGPRGQSPTLLFNGTGAQFEDWAARNASAILAILFPAGVGASVSGRAPGELYAQQFLLTSVLSTEEARRSSGRTRADAAGLIEFEQLSRDGKLADDAAWAWQGLYAFNDTVSIQGRFAQQREFFTTRSTAVSVDYHPYAEFERGIVWRVGGTLRSGVLYSNSAALTLGSIELGGGGWVSGFKDLGGVRLAGATMVHGSKSYVPSVFDGAGDGYAFLADALNAQGVQYDVAYGASAAVDVSERASVMGKWMTNLPLTSTDARSGSWWVMTGLSYRLGLPSINVGYKRYATRGLHAHSVFLQGRFDW